MQISNVSKAEILRTMEGNLLIRYTVKQPNLIVNGKTASHTATVLLRGEMDVAMDVEFHDLRPWATGAKLSRVK